MSADRKSIGCVVMIAGALIIGGAVVHDSKPSNQAPVLSQPETGPVRRDPPAARESSYTRDSAPTPTPTPTHPPVLIEPVYTPPAPPPLTRAQILDSNPVQSEPLPGLQGQANTLGSDAALNLINHLPSPAYVKVVNGYGTTVATVYLRTQESYQLEIPAGSYQVKYASGSASQWRGPLYYFGSSTSFHKGDFTDIPTNQILSLTFYQIVTKGYASGGTPTISAEEFER
jgi:hypothetical protein